MVDSSYNFDIHKLCFIFLVKYLQKWLMINSMILKCYWIATNKVESIQFNERNGEGLYECQINV